MAHFTLSYDYITGFQDHIRIDLLNPYDLRRQRLSPSRTDHNSSDPIELKKIIEHNASLRVDFGWSFESDKHLISIMNDCMQDIIPKYNVNVGRIVSDMRCSWIGFEPHNMYDKEEYKDFSVYSLIVYNNEIIDFQSEVIHAVVNHTIFRQQAFLRDEWYRFETLKAVRKDRELLNESYQYYMKAIHDTCGLMSIPRDLLENNIGAHFLYHPDLFFELLEFSILKGEVYE